MIDWRSLPADAGHPQRRRKEARMRMAAPVAGTFVPSLHASLGPLCTFWDLPAAQGVSQRGPPLCGPVSVEPGAQPQMSSHNSRLAADSYKNCVWTISGEAPEFRAPVPLGVLPGSLKAHTRSRELRIGIPRRSSAIAARPAGKVDKLVSRSRPC